MNQNVVSATRNVAIVGPYLSGKTTLLESLLFVTGAISRKGSIKDGNTVGDSVIEARDRQMSVEISAASTEYQKHPLHLSRLSRFHRIRPRNL